MAKQYRAKRWIKLAGKTRGTGGWLRQEGDQVRNPAVPTEYLRPGQVVTSEQANRLGKDELKRLEADGALESREKPEPEQKSPEAEQQPTTTATPLQTQTKPSSTETKKS